VTALVAAGTVVRKIDEQAPVQPSREQARAWATEELAHREYQAERPGPIQLFVGWLRDQLDKVPAPGGIDLRMGLAVAVLLLLVVVGYVVWRSGGVGRQAKVRGQAVFEAAGRTADEHRRASDAAEAAGDHRTALLERFRAIARALADRAIIEPSPGLTADELARQAAVRLPGLAQALAAGARSFDDVRYGDHPATAAAVRALAELDTRAAATTPAPRSTSQLAGLAVPR
jgi:hypothetical protein